jgi:inorganic triphosphatase YgiF
MFKTEVRRGVMNVRLNRSDIEVAFDRGKVIAGRRTAPICEIELELKQGHPRDLAILAQRLGKTVPIAFNAETKADRGYALKLGEERKAVDAERTMLDAGQTARAAFGQIGLSCLRHISSNLNAVDAEDGEGIHQMRVGLRRLRAAISLFAPVLGGKETQEIKRELRWLADELGPARDLDVLIQEAVEPLRARHPDQPELATLERGVAHERRKEFERARAAVGSDRYRRLVLATAIWLINGGGSRRRDEPSQSHMIIPVATEILDDLTKKVIKKARMLGGLDPKGRHRLRIAIKKLRYASEFFESLFGHPKRRKRFGRMVSDLQDCLGRLNDITVHMSRGHRLARARRRSPQQAKQAYAIGFLAGQEEVEAGARERDAERVARKLAKAERFW